MVEKEGDVPRAGSQIRQRPPGPGEMDVLAKVMVRNY